MRNRINVFPFGHYTSANCDAYMQKYIKEGDTVLDIGTGTGVLSYMAKKYKAGRVLAVDVDEDAVECARENLKEFDDVEVKQNYLNFDIDEKFDLIVANLDMNASMELIQYVKRTMKDDGILILTWYSKWDCKDMPLKMVFNVLEHTEGQEYNCYALTKEKIMVTVHAMRNVDGDKLYAYDFIGLSTDTKPTFWGGKLIEANSMFLEADTGDFYYCESEGSKGKKTLLYENDSLTDWEDNGSNYYFCILKTELNVEDLPSTAIIKWDANEYECAIKELDEGYEYGYGGEFDGFEYDFSTYPFSVHYEKREDGNEITFISPNNNTHSIEIYSLTPDTPAVWKKVGSGS